jgi:KipI family sensor histidine kinase inhibitor
VIGMRAAGDAALVLEIASGSTDQDGNGAASLAALIRAAALPGVIDVVPGAVTVLVTVRPGSWILADLAARLTGLTSGAAARQASAAGHPARVTDIDVCYDGPDLADVAALTGLTIADVIARHQAAAYRVGWLGFAPGFAYLTGLDPLLATVPRLDSPRLSVPAGSVAIAAGLAAVYPAASPGGWRLLGRASLSLWDPDRDPAALLAPGTRVRFRAVDDLPLAPEQVPAGLPASPAAAVAGARRVEVLQPGPLATVQDLGRAGLAHLGVPASGAADASSLRLANDLVGNDAGAAGLEVTLGRLALRFDCDAVVAVTGAPVPIRVSGAAVGLGGVSSEGEVSGGRNPVPGVAFAVAAGSVLRLGTPPAGLRSYVAIDGGIGVRPVLGSRAADCLSGLGPGPLRPGDWLPLDRPRSGPNERREWRPRGAEPAEFGPGPVELRAIAGPRDDWFAAGALDVLTGGSYVVSPASNRTGLRLTGPALRRGRSGELLSEGMTAGSLQVTHEGQPILLLADHPTTGGYPVIAVILAADLGRAAQLRPGQQVRFRVSPGLAWPAQAGSAG